MIADAPGIRRVVAIVAALNLAYFGVEFTAAQTVGSVALLADSIDFLEDASVNLLILFALGWSIAARRRVGLLLAIVLLVPGIATLAMVVDKVRDPVIAAPLPVGLVALGALTVNITCAALLARWRHSSGSLTRAAFLSARNDVAANVAIIAVGLVTAFVWTSIWPDVIVGLAIAALNIDAARDVWTAAVAERHEART